MRRPRYNKPAAGGHSMSHDWHRDMEPLPIKAAGVASFLRSSGRPRAAEWVQELGGNYEAANKTIFELRTQVNELLSRLAKYEPRKQGDGLSQIPHTNKSEWE